MHLHSMVKYKSQIIYVIISQEIFYWTQVTRKNFGTSPISTPSGSPIEIRIGCVAMFLTSSHMEQYLYTNKWKYVVWYYTSSIGLLQEIILMIYHIDVISWDMQLIQKWLFTGSQTIILGSKEPIMFDLINTIIFFPYKTSTLKVRCPIKNILKVFFTIWTSSTWFRVNLILYTLYFVIQ